MNLQSSPIYIIRKVEIPQQNRFTKITEISQQ
jgi:hypothetical protein